MNFNIDTLKTELTDEMTAALSFVIGERCIVAFADPVESSGKLIKRGSIDGEYSTDSLDGEISAKYSVIENVATVKELTFKFGDRDIVTVDFHEHTAFIKSLENAYNNYKLWLRKPTHRADLKSKLVEAKAKLTVPDIEGAVKLINQVIEEV